MNVHILFGLGESWGTMLARVLASKPCNPKQTENPIESKGWVVASQPTDKQAQNINVSA